MSDGESLHPGDVVAVTLPPGAAWLDVLARAWGEGAAVLPIDRRLPAATARRLVERARPTVVVDEAGALRRSEPGADRELAAVVATSGTEGEPKLVELTRHAVRSAVEGSASALGADAGTSWLACLTPAHVGGLLVLLRGVLLGSRVTVHPRFDARAILAQDGVDAIAVVPAMLARLVQLGADLSAFGTVLVGGGALDGELRRTAEALGARVVHTYGLAESCGGVVYEGIPFVGTEVRVDPVVARIELHGPTLMRGYRDDAGASLAALSPDGWLRTNDAGAIGNDGRLHVHGRLDEAIRTGGETVWPGPVEASLRGHPGVEDVAVAGRPDAEWGQRVVAFVVPVDRARPPTLEELRAHVAASLPRWAAPRQLVLLDALPRNPNGKLVRAGLEVPPQAGHGA